MDCCLAGETPAPPARVPSADPPSGATTDETLVSEPVYRDPRPVLFGRRRQAAHGHGFRIDIDANNKLVLHSDDPTVGTGLIYKAPSLLGPATSRSQDHPGYDVDTFNGPSGFSNGESIGFDATGPLWYSDGGTTIPSPEGVNMVITPQDLGTPGSVTVTGTSEIQGGFLIGVYDGFALARTSINSITRSTFRAGFPWCLQLGLAIDRCERGQPAVCAFGAVHGRLQQWAERRHVRRGLDFARRPWLEIPGDVNFDGVVSIFDINLVSANWNTPGPTGDANGDHAVNIFDINLISAHWGDNIYGGSGAHQPCPSRRRSCWPCWRAGDCWRSALESRAGVSCVVANKQSVHLHRMGPFSGTTERRCRNRPPSKRRTYVGVHNTLDFRRQSQCVFKHYLFCCWSRPLPA